MYRITFELFCCTFFLQCADNLMKMIKSSHFILWLISVPYLYVHGLLQVFLQCAVKVMRMNTSCHFIVVCVYPRFSYIVPDLSLHGFLLVFIRRFGALSKRAFCGGSSTKISCSVFDFGSRPVTYF